MNFGARRDERDGRAGERALTSRAVGRWEYVRACRKRSCPVAKPSCPITQVQPGKRRSGDDGEEGAVMQESGLYKGKHDKNLQHGARTKPLDRIRKSWRLPGAGGPANCLGDRNSETNQRPLESVCNGKTACNFLQRLHRVVPVVPKQPGCVLALWASRVPTHVKGVAVAAIG